MIEASTGFTVAFLITVGAVAALAIAALGTAAGAVGVAAWLALTGGLAASGVLVFEPVPTIVGLLVGIFVVVFAVVFRGPGNRILARVPLALLVGYQAFRIPVELLLHRAYVEGIIPVQMTYIGWNYDVLTGLSAIVVAGLIARDAIGRRGILAWNIAGLALLLNIVTIALLSTPSPLRAFHNEPANEWIAHAPWVWLPTVLVAAALAGHLLVFRALRAEAAPVSAAG